jgi:hypothetical protein
MPQTILLTGTILASSMVCVLLALLLHSAIKDCAWRVSISKSRRWRIHDDNHRCTANSWEEAVRGYDTPELYREDLLARTDRSEQKSLH